MLSTRRTVRAASAGRAASLWNLSLLSQLFTHLRSMKRDAFKAPDGLKVVRAVVSIAANENENQSKLKITKLLHY